MDGYDICRQMPREGAALTCHSVSVASSKRGHRFSTALRLPSFCPLLWPMVHTQTTLAPAARGKGAVAAQGRAPLDDYAPGRSPRLRGLPAAPSPSARWLPGRGYHGWLSRLTPYRRQHSLKSLNETVPYPYSRGDSVMSQRATQSSTKAAPKQHQSSTKAAPKQHQSSTKAVSKQHRSSIKVVPK